MIDEEGPIYPNAATLIFFCRDKDAGFYVKLLQQMIHSTECTGRRLWANPNYLVPRSYTQIGSYSGIMKWD